MSEVKGADRIEKWPIEKLRGYKKNSRTHSEDQIAKIAASIAEFGFTNPVLAKADGELIAGHGRVMAASQLGIKTVPVIVLDYLTEAQRRAYIIADNQLATLAGWDDKLLSEELRDLMGIGFDLNLVGFDSAELDRLLIGEQEEEDEGTGDFVPEVTEKAVSQLGDIWILGDHRIICGDCTRPETVTRLLNGNEPHLMVTDPPYGVEYDPAWRNESLGEGNLSVGEVVNDDRADWRDAWELFPGDVAYVWHAGSKGDIVAASLQACEFQIRTQIIWAKQHFAIGRGHYHVQHEPCFYAVRKGKTGHWSGDRTQSTLWQISNGLSQGGPRKSEDELTGHGTQKPVECMLRPILNNSQRGDAVYEPFSGSGTTIIAAEKSGRRCFAVELNQPYVDVAVRRWEKFTGKKAIHADTKRTFSEMQAERT